MTNPIDQALPLELLHAAPQIPLAGRAPLVFVHGAFCGAWVWEEHFLPFFADAGHDAYAVSLRGHGGSGGGDLLRDASMDDYVQDLKAVIDRLDRPAVLIGHSMGGMVVQRYVEAVSAAHPRRFAPVRGMVLMSAVAPGGLLATAADMMLRDPMLLSQIGALQTFGPCAVVPEGLHRAMFPPNAPTSLTRRYMNRMQPESLRVQLDMAFSAPPLASNGRLIPSLVLGADHDAFVPRWVIEATARYYGTESVILEDTGHAMMLGPTWETAAREIRDWLDAAEL